MAQQRAYDAQQMQREHMQEFVDKFYNEKRSSAQVQLPFRFQPTCSSQMAEGFSEWSLAFLDQNSLTLAIHVTGGASQAGHVAAEGVGEDGTD